ncbi:MAG: hypothetical protein K2N03_00890 [Muribaculaceae bacterium]|nr:hypothetical protein [Muribaculaceae bacterium]
MKKVTHLLLLMLFIGSLGASAQFKHYDYKILYNLQGPVKDVKIKTKTPVVKDFSSFTLLECGAKRISAMSYDETGRPVGFQISDSDEIEKYDVIYGADNHTKEIIISTIDRNDNVEQTVIMPVYDKNRLQELTIDSPGNVTRCTYSREIYDDYGNWIKRSVRMETTDKKNTSTPVVSSFEESRKIKYYISH